MGYKISYGSDRAYKSKDKKYSFRIITIIVLVLVLAIHFMWPESISQAWHILLPVVSESQGTLSSMIEQIQTGVPLADAITSFCQEIIDTAEFKNAQ